MTVTNKSSSSLSSYHPHTVVQLPISPIGILKFEMEYPIDYPTSIRALNNKTPKGFKPVEQLDFASDFASSSDAHSILIYKGKKYNWQVKQELHIHIIEHLFLDCLEVVGKKSN